MLTNKAKANLSLIFNLLCHVYDRLCCVKMSWQRHWQVMMYWFMSRWH